MSISYASIEHYFAIYMVSILFYFTLITVQFVFDTSEFFLYLGQYRKLKTKELTILRF